MKIVAQSVLGHATYFVKLIPSTSDETTTPIVRMCSNPDKAAEMDRPQAEAVLREVHKCYPSAVIEVEPNMILTNSEANVSLQGSPEAQRKEIP